MLEYRFDYRHTYKMVENRMIENHGKLFLYKYMFEGLMPDILLIQVKKYFHIPPSLKIPNHIKSIIKLSVSRFSKQFQGNKIFIGVIEL